MFRASRPFRGFVMMIAVAVTVFGLVGIRGHVAAVLEFAFEEYGVRIAQNVIEWWGPGDAGTLTERFLRGRSEVY